MPGLAAPQDEELQLYFLVHEARQVSRCTGSVTKSTRVDVPDGRLLEETVQRQLVVVRGVVRKAFGLLSGLVEVTLRMQRLQYFRQLG